MRENAKLAVAVAWGLLVVGCDVGELPADSAEADRQGAQRDDAGPVDSSGNSNDASAMDDAGTPDAGEIGGDGPADAGALAQEDAETSGDDAANDDLDGAIGAPLEPDAQQPDAASEMPPTVSIARVYEILSGPCGDCHSVGKKLDLSTPTTAYNELVDVAAEYGACAGGGHVLVVPYDADASLLVQKLEGTPPCGNPMPVGAPLLSQELIDEIRAWIDSGASQD